MGDYSWGGAMEGALDKQDEIRAKAIKILQTIRTRLVSKFDATSEDSPEEDAFGEAWDILEDVVGGFDDDGIPIAFSRSTKKVGP